MIPAAMATLRDSASPYRGMVNRWEFAMLLAFSDTPWASLPNKMRLSGVNSMVLRACPFISASQIRDLLCAICA